MPYGQGGVEAELESAAAIGVDRVSEFGYATRPAADEEHDVRPARARGASVAVIWLAASQSLSAALSKSTTQI